MILVALMLSGVVGKAQTDLILTGSNQWIFHTPDDNRTDLFIAPFNQQTKGWVWNSQTVFHNNGNVDFNGSLNAKAFNQSSDLRFKTNILPLNSALPKLMIMQPVTYNWKVKEFSNRGFTTDLQIGFIAQDVQKLFPELVTTGTDGYLSLDYSKVTPILVKAVQEQQEIINQMREQITLLKNQNIEMKASIEDLQISKTKTSKR